MVKSNGNNFFEFKEIKKKEINNNCLNFYNTCLL